MAECCHSFTVELTAVNGPIGGLNSADRTLIVTGLARYPDRPDMPRG